ncbi:glycosyltransferase family 4 protein [Candidatus Kuenenbacteria bacterium CG_4_9_14_3_um_filter_39_14]|uniref:Glycosyltransferase family 4 protein n=6 Tax=Candidatus Kueneniibacteriota TaxID=1752740 RepID=A0A2M7IM50_9BACT|nr:glycosyltransferase family 4 protein [Candidatus Kuenenbacteria bacterium]OIP56050.1 MAG: hypothetical protein AUK13_01745 [Candidatus Kuenenbacteria bacterium CG2_30_39_24]PIP75415.1 MAG: glycosyl transferase [Candidatus Kuenenbacteria bacterium CG22_combo_CG10-13_8_21_14_all_39_9]PIR81104.1 MAG: glycosyltransferase family 4 protein [Candidatus Kuenenbacteria bacterium CG10_big_fil_rev_8_21_14_0_10_39_14]PIW95916.1 MAG: glycosyltransferase family 4 protein [Candidatus Kuenenbacteria bacteri
MKIALVHDYLTQLGGAEKVLQNLQEVFKDSPVFVLVNNKKITSQIFDQTRIVSSWLQNFPLAISRYQWYLALMPSAVESHRLNDFDVVISSASSIAKAVKIRPDALHVCYCHTPTRYLWHDAEHYVEELKYNQLVKKIISLFLKRLRHWDFLAARRVNYFIANSRLVQARIKKYYGRESKIIYPPVDTQKFYIAQRLDNYYLSGGRLVAYKRYDLAIRAFNKLGIKLKIFGSGSDYPRLKKMACKNIEFLGNITDTAKAELYAHTLAFIHPQVEDFGITAVESMAAGRPVIAYRAGGALETVVPDVSGEFFDEQNWESLANQIIHFKQEKFHPQLIKAHAERFNSARFQQEIKDYIGQLINDYEIDRVFKIKLL